MSCPKLLIFLRYEVWKTQPSEFEAAKNASNAGDYYIEAAKSTKYAPDRLPSDHTAILSAYPMFVSLISNCQFVQIKTVMC